MLVFHGSRQDATSFRAFSGHQTDAFAGRDGAVVAYLDGHDQHWNDARAGSAFSARAEGIDDVAFADAVVAMFPGLRVFAMGFSNGGQMVIRLVHERGAVLAGAAVVAATMPAAGNFVGTDAPVEPVPLVLFHGTADPLVPYAGGMSSLWGSQERGLGLSAPETAASFADRNGLADEPVETAVPHDPAVHASTHVTRLTYPGNHPVTLFTVHGGGHTVPGPTKAPVIMGRTTRDVVAADEIARLLGI